MIAYHDVQMSDQEYYEYDDDFIDESAKQDVNNLNEEQDESEEQAICDENDLEEEEQNRYIFDLQKFPVFFADNNTQYYRKDVLKYFKSLADMGDIKRITCYSLVLGRSHNPNLEIFEESSRYLRIGSKYREEDA